MDSHLDCVLTLCQVRRDRTGVEPEWLMGKIGSREGLFPEAFVQPVEEPSVYDTARTTYVSSASVVQGCE